MRYIARILRGEVLSRDHPGRIDADPPGGAGIRDVEFDEGAVRLTQETVRPQSVGVGVNLP